MEKKWFVINTRPLQEIRVADYLNDLGINTYCPTVNLIKQYSDRKKKIKKPLLSSYVMVQLEHSERNRVFSCPGVIRYLFFLGKPAEVPCAEIDLMKNHLNGVYKEVQSNRLCVGQTHKIQEGPFSGHRGTVVENNKSKVKLVLESMGISITLKKKVA